jgi:hypothetical protein
VIDDEIGRFPDLPLAALAVADDAVDVAVDLVHARRRGEAGGDGQTLPSEPVAASRRGTPTCGCGWPSIGLSMARRVMASARVMGRPRRAPCPAGTIIRPDRRSAA